MGALGRTSIRGWLLDLKYSMTCLNLEELGMLRSSGNSMEQEGSQNKAGQRQRELEVLGKVYS